MYVVVWEWDNIQHTCPILCLGRILAEELIICNYIVRYAHKWAWHLFKFDDMCIPRLLYEYIPKIG